MSMLQRSKQEEIYNAHIVSLSQIPAVQHVSGNGNEIITFEKVDGAKVGLPSEEDVVEAKIYIYEEAFGEDPMMDLDIFLPLTPERAPLLYKVLTPSVESGHATYPIVSRSGVKTAKEALTGHATLEAFRNAGFLYTSAVGETASVSSYGKGYDNGELLVIIRGYDESYVSRNGTGVISLEGFRADVERSALIRAALVAYYGTEGVEAV